MKGSEFLGLEDYVGGDANIGRGCQHWRDIQVSKEPLITFQKFEVAVRLSWKKPTTFGKFQEVRYVNVIELQLAK